MVVHAFIALLFLALMILSAHTECVSKVGVIIRPFYKMALYLSKHFELFGMVSAYVLAQFFAIICVGNLFGGILLIKEDLENSNTVGRNILARKSDETYEKTLNVKIDGFEKEQRINLEVPEIYMSKEEIDISFDEMTGKLESIVLGENTSFDKISHNLSLPSKVEDYPFEIFWENDRPVYLGSEGKLMEGIPDEGAYVTLTAKISYMHDENYEKSWQRTLKVYPAVQDEAEYWKKRIIQAVKDKAKEDATSFEIELPGDIDGRSVSFSPPTSYRGLIVLVFSVVCAVLFVAGRRQDEQKSKKDRQNQMALDYPEIVSTFSLLIGAGMSMRRAFARIVLDYQKKISAGEKTHRYAYDELTVIYRLMQSGLPEAEAYAQIAYRCDAPEYKIFSMLLVQNLKKGTKDLARLLEQEVTKAFEDRKRSARARGEEAGTKMLFPMLLMFLDVLILIIVPALMSMY